MHHSRVFKILTAAVLLPVFFASCFDPQEGCLDTSAINFNPAADKDCCCRYPSLVLSVEQVYGSQVFKQDSLYEDAGGHLFRIKNMVFYLSEFQVFRGAETFTMGDSLEFKTYDATRSDTILQTFIDDYTLIRRVPLENSVASFRESGEFDKIRFRVGLSQAATAIIPALTPSNHPLRPQKENLYANGDYVLLQAVVVRDSMAATAVDTLNFTRSDIGDLFVSGNWNFQHDTGYNFTVKLKTDWAVLFDGVDWTNHDVQAWKDRIVANLPSIFTISQ